jgi:hypothetical protein
LPVAPLTVKPLIDEIVDEFVETFLLPLLKRKIAISHKFRLIPTPMHRIYATPDNLLIFFRHMEFAEVFTHGLLDMKPAHDDNDIVAKYDPDGSSFGSTSVLHDKTNHKVDPKSDTKMLKGTIKFNVIFRLFERL